LWAYQQKRASPEHPGRIRNQAMLGQCRAIKLISLAREESNPACPLWVISGPSTRRLGMSACRLKPDLATRSAERPLCAMWTAPSWQGFSSRLQHWSVQPCVRPVSAVRMTAGHNALRGVDPGQKPAQPSHHAGCSGAISFTPQARRVLCSVPP
jgi:hypothetical protein